MDNFIKVRKLLSDDVVQIHLKQKFINDVSHRFNNNLNNVLQNNLTSYYGVFKQNQIAILGWAFREQKFNRGGMFCCKIQFKIFQNDEKEETIAQFAILINEMTQTLSKDPTIYKILLVIDKELEPYYHEYQSFSTDSIKMKHKFQ